MKNVKDQVYAALCTVSENVSDAYPCSWAEGSTIQYTEEQNDVYEASSDAEGMREDKALCLLECRRQELQDETESFRNRTPGK